MKVAPHEWNEWMQVSPHIILLIYSYSTDIVCFLVAHLLLFSVQKDIQGKSPVVP